MKSHYMYLLFFFLLTNCRAQEDPATTSDPIIRAPEDWARESFSLPPDFAPEINYQGKAEVRFAPGWDDSSSDLFWTYAFAWHVEGGKEHKPESMTELLESYFTGLSVATARGKEMSTPDISPAIATIEVG